MKMAEVSSVAAEDHVSSLRRRLWVLEQKVMGNQPPDKHPLLDTLDILNRRLQTFSSKSEVVKKAWQKIPELETILKPGVATSPQLTVKAKEELLLCYTEQMEGTGSQVDQLLSLKKVVNSSAFQGMESQQTRISSLAKTHIRQEEEAAELSAQVEKFVDTYSKLLLQISSKCVELNDTVTQLEKSSQR